MNIVDNHAHHFTKRLAHRDPRKGLVVPVITDIQIINAQTDPNNQTGGQHEGSPKVAKAIRFHMCLLYYALPWLTSAQNESPSCLRRGFFVSISLFYVEQGIGTSTVGVDFEMQMSAG